VLAVGKTFDYTKEGEAFYLGRHFIVIVLSGEWQKKKVSRGIPGKLFPEKRETSRINQRLRRGHLLDEKEDEVTIVGKRGKTGGPPSFRNESGWKRRGGGREENDADSGPASPSSRRKGGNSLREEVRAFQKGENSLSQKLRFVWKEGKERWEKRMLTEIASAPLAYITAERRGA